MTTATIEKKSDQVSLVTLNRPDSLNAFDGALRTDLLEAMTKASEDDDIRCVVLTGAGRAFCAGADVKDVNGKRNVEDVLNTEYGAFLSVIRTCPKPVIAAINGPAAGIGMTLALSCDLRVMDESAYMMSAFANIGLVPDGGLSALLTQQIGYARAYEFAIEAQKVPAQRCLELGLINRVVANGDALDNALQWAEELSARAPIALALTKRAFRAGAEHNLANAAMYEAQLQRTAIKTEDCQEGIAALIGKRKPAFKNK